LRKNDPVIVPGDRVESELIRRITSDDPDEVMPPRKSGKMLTAGGGEVLARWIDQGAARGRPLGFAPRRRRGPAAAGENGLAAEPDRGLRPSPPRGGAAQALTRGRAGRVDPPRFPRLDRASPDAG